MAGAQLGLWAPVHGKAMVIGFRVFQTCPHLSVAIKQFFLWSKCASSFLASFLVWPNVYECYVDWYDMLASVRGNR